MSRRGVLRFRVVGVVVTAVALFAASATPAKASTTPNTAGPPTLTKGVQPSYSSGNVTACPKGATTFINTSSKGPGNQPGSYSAGGTTFTTTVDRTGSLLSFTTTSPSFVVYVKGGPGYDTYNYQGDDTHAAFPADTGLHAPYNNGGNIPTISHYVACGLATKASPALATTPSAGAVAGSNR